MCGLDAVCEYNHLSSASHCSVVVLPHLDHYTAFTPDSHEHWPEVTGDRVSAIQEPVLGLLGLTQSLESTLFLCRAYCPYNSRVRLSPGHGSEYPNPHGSIRLSEHLSGSLLDPSMVEPWNLEKYKLDS